MDKAAGVYEINAKILKNNPMISDLSTGIKLDPGQVGAITKKGSKTIASMGVKFANKASAITKPVVEGSITGGLGAGVLTLGATQAHASNVVDIRKQQETQRDVVRHSKGVK